MDFLFAILERIVGDDTDPIDLLPLVVLGVLWICVRHLRALLIDVLKALGALSGKIDIVNEIRALRNSDTHGRPDA